MTDEHGRLAVLDEYGRLAVLSDIHGVLPALEAVLAEPEVAAADRIVLTGDITAGPQPAEVLDLLREQGPSRAPSCATPPSWSWTSRRRAWTRWPPAASSNPFAA